MIDGLEGIPGSGKSYESTVFHVLAAVKAGRLVITNLPLDVEAFERVVPGASAFIEFRTVPQPIRGRWVAKNAGTEKPLFDLFEDGHVEDPPESATVFGGVWDYYSTWKRADGRGPLFVLDECHVPLPTIGTDKEVIQWFKMHRHYNVDVLLMTQSFRDMCQEIARLIRALVKVRKADILGDADSYIRKVHSGYRGGLVSTETRKYNPAFFGLYKSHTQGVAASEEGVRDVAPLVVKVRRATWAVFALAAVATVWAWWPSEKKVSHAKAPASIASQDWYKEAQRNAGRPMLPASHAAGERQVEASKPVGHRLMHGVAEQPRGKGDELPEPYGPKGLHMLGMLQIQGKGGPVYLLTISQNGAVVSTTTSAELVKVGYVFRALSDCVAVVKWGLEQRVVTCDSPSITVAGQPRVESKAEPRVQ